MKFRVEVVVEDDAGQEMQRIVAMERQCNATDTPICGLGLTILDGKNLLGTIQKQLLESEVKAISCQHADCKKCAAPLKRKDMGSIVYRTLFGKYALDSARFFACGRCEDLPKKSFSPLPNALSTHTHPELAYLQARWVSLISYGQSLRLLEDVLPIEGVISLTNMKDNVSQIGQRIEAEREVQQNVGMLRSEVTEATPPGGEGISPSIVVGVDAGYIRSNAAKDEGPRRFGVIAAKTIETDSRCHAYVQAEVDDGGTRIAHFIGRGKDLPQPPVIFLTDGGSDIKSATPLPGKSSQRILDWFHLAMAFQVVLKTATSLKRWRYSAKFTVIEEIERIKWKFWHGQSKGGSERLRLLATWIGLHPSTKTKDKLAQRLFNLFHYVEDNADHLVHYSRRHRDGLPISSAIAESVVNQVISHRFVKKQQMRWSPELAHRLLQVRTAVLNDELAMHFKRWHPGFKINDPAYARTA